MIRKLLLEGKNHVETFYSPFLGKSFRIRPLTVWEMDEVIVSAIRGIKQKKVQDLLINMNLARIGMQEEMDLSIDEYADFVEYGRRIDYEICYHAMKDFAEDPDFATKDLKDSRLEIHDMAKQIRLMSIRNPKVLEEFVMTRDGLTLAHAIFELNLPLTDEAWKLTPLQHDYLMGNRVIHGSNQEGFDDEETAGESPKTMLEVFFDDLGPETRPQP